MTSFLGFLLSLTALTVLVIFGTLYGNAAHIAGFTIFGLGLTLLYLTSTVYHLIPITHPRKALFRKMDHSMIYVLIACTYTPIMLVIPQKALAWGILGIIWGMALIGIIIKIRAAWNKENKWLIPLPYVVMGWIGIAAIRTLLETFPAEGLRWLFYGGVLYTSGVIFYLADSIFPRMKLVGMHEFWHVFVIGGSLSHVWFMFKYVLNA